MNPDASKWLEIGSYIGESSLIISSFDFVKELTCIDPIINTARQDVEECFRKRLYHYMKYNNLKVKFHQAYSEIFVHTVDDDSLDVVYIDGDHSYGSVLQDINLWYPKIKQNGFLCGHDYDPNHPGVIKAVFDFLAKNKHLKLHTYIDTSFLIKKCI